jgi:hypothetical protein
VPCCMPVIPATGKAEIGGSQIEARPGQQVSKNPSQRTIGCMVMHGCGLSYTGGRDRITV